VRIEDIASLEDEGEKLQPMNVRERRLGADARRGGIAREERGLWDKSMECKWGGRWGRRE